MNNDMNIIKRIKSRRSKNFTEKEKNYLIHLVEGYCYILDNKATDAATVYQKNEVWKEIALKYNSFAESGFRDIVQLKNLFKNVKRTTKNMEMYYSGGGYLTPQINEIDNNKVFMSPQLSETENKELMFDHKIMQPYQNFYENGSHCNGDSISNSLSSHENFIPKITPNKRKPSKCKRRKIISVEALKRAYLKKKYQCVCFQYKAMRQLHFLDMKIKREQLKQLQNNSP